MLPAIGTILYATDLEAHAPRVFGYAVDLARRYDASLVLLHAIEPIGATAASLVRNVVPADRLEELHRAGMEQVHQEIREWVERFRATELEGSGEKLVSEVRVVEEQPARAVLDQARAVGADLIVMGTHGRVGVSEFMLGSVAHKVMQHSPVPVLLVPLRSG